MYQLHKVVSHPVVILAVRPDMGSILACLFAGQSIRMLCVPLLLDLIFRNYTVAVKTIASRRAVEDFASALGAAVMAATWEASLVEEAYSAGGVLLIWRGRRSLDVSSIRIHGHLDADFGNALVLAFLLVHRSRASAVAGRGIGAR
jgi:uncharacterized membrane protein YqgA involved in biofilm formation